MGDGFATLAPIATGRGKFNKRKKMTTEIQSELIERTPEETRLATRMTAETTPVELLSRLVQQGNLTTESVSVAKELVHLIEHMEDRRAERDFAQAFAGLQTELKTFQATKVVPDKHGNPRYTYLPYEAIMREVQPLLERHGFSLSFSTDFQDSRIVQTCTLQHIAGHHRDYKAFVRAGAGPYGATETQADGAAMTYAKRYALCNCLNIVVERDTDGNRPEDAKEEGTVISSDQLQYIREQMNEANFKEETLLTLAGVATMEQITQGKYQVLLNAITMKRARR